MDMLQFVPVEVRQQLHWAGLEKPNVDAAWGIWSSAAESGLLNAYKAAGGPCPQGDLPFFGRVRLFFVLGSLVVEPLGESNRPARTDPVDCEG